MRWCLVEYLRTMRICVKDLFQGFVSRIVHVVEFIGVVAVVFGFEDGYRLEARNQAIAEGQDS